LFETILYKHCRIDMIFKQITYFWHKWMVRIKHIRSKIWQSYPSGYEDKFKILHKIYIIVEETIWFCQLPQLLLPEQLLYILSGTNSKSFDRSGVPSSLLSHISKVELGVHAPLTHASATCATSTRGTLPTPLSPSHRKKERLMWLILGVKRF